MSDIITEDMFSQIQKEFDKKKTGGGQYKDVLRLKEDSTVEVRLLPYLKDPSKTMFFLPYHQWMSKSTGKLIEAIDPSIIDEPNPIANASYELGKKLKARNLTKDHPEMKDARNLWRKDSWLYNVYVIDDPNNPENNGQVKVLRVKVKLQELIEDHFMGNRKEDYGNKIFSLGENGCNLKIVSSEKNGFDAWNYDKSYFTGSRGIPGVSDNKEKIQEVLESCFDLSTIYPIKTYDELKDIVNIHFFNEMGNSDESQSDNNTEDDLDDVLGDIEDKNDKDTVEESTDNKKSPKKKEDKDVDDNDIDSMLADMGIN